MPSKQPMSALPRTGFCNVDLAYARLLELVMDGALLPNTHHLLVSLASRYGLADDDLELAATRLERRALIRTDGRGGFWVAPILVEDVIVGFDEVAALEARAAYLAAVHGPSAIGLAALDDAVLTMEDANYRHDRLRWAKAAHHFHRSLVQCCGHEPLASAALAKSKSMHRMRMIGLNFAPPPIHTAERHALLIDALRRGAPTEARDLHLAYWRDETGRITSILRRHHLDTIDR